MKLGATRYSPHLKHLFTKSHASPELLQRTPKAKSVLTLWRCSHLSTCVLHVPPVFSFPLWTLQLPVWRFCGCQGGPQSSSVSWFCAPLWSCWQNRNPQLKVEPPLTHRFVTAKRNALEMKRFFPLEPYTSQEEEVPDSGEPFKNCCEPALRVTDFAMAPQVSSQAAVPHASI